MFVGLTIFFIILSIAAHELGHAWAMHRQGVQLDRIGIGIPIKYIPSLKLKPKRWNGLSLELHPLLIGAFVSTTDEGDKTLKELPYSRKALIYGAGIVANLIFAGILFICIILSLGVSFSDLIDKTHFLIYLGCTLFLIVGYKIFCRYLIILLGFGLLALVIWTIFKDPFKAMIGPMGLVKLVGDNSIGVIESIWLAGAISMLIGLTNALPFYPLDGGLLVGGVIEKFTKSKKAVKVFNRVGLISFFGIIALAVCSDVINIFF